MGRHRRSGAAPAADDHAADAAGTPRGHRGGRHGKRGLPLRGGLLGASAAMAVGAVAVTSGVLPGGDTFTIGGGAAPQERIRTGGPAELDAQGRADAVRSGAAPSSAAPSSASPSLAAPSKSPSHGPSASPAPSAPSSPSVPSSSPARTKSAPPAPAKTRTSTPAPRTEAPPVPEKTAEKPAAKPPSLVPTSRAAAAEAAVLELVNRERAKAGCSPVRASTDLGDLARAFSQDMAARDFFSHTDPDGDGPWERAAQAGVDGLGGENIARGQADAAAVMESWMNSQGHRDNILNCDFTRLGVGVHIAPGGPWWTQNFGF
ncbi:CAP domain-containing protein [Streptomyces fradiae]|uniref:CAP domain-containing protein n=1 Tax=Streptomyces fradiae TaxID=1906 RepID=UPI0029422873|nr:CAP domain-containing protein [Streptomyces fradiae]WOI62242.1 CAP domain-containing protein [Streptomyces fradiae]